MVQSQRWLIQRPGQLMAKLPIRRWRPAQTGPRTASSRGEQQPHRLDLSKREKAIMLWIISGPTSVGKSTFLASPRCTELTGLPSGSPVYWPVDNLRAEDLSSVDAYFHYNILRPLKHSREL